MFASLSSQISRIIEQRPFCKDILQSYDALLSIMSYEEPEVPEIILERRLLKTKLESGFPLFSKDELPVDTLSGGRVFLRFLKHFQHSEGDGEERFKKSILYFKKDQALLQGLFKAVLKNDQKMLSNISNQTSLEPERLYFLAKTALKPSLDLLRTAFADKLDKTIWDQGYCPFCGSGPAMAYLDKSGKRHLHCEFCGEEWPYPRLNCPFCQNDDHNTLGYFDADKDEGFRVDFCRKCGRYIKTVDRRSLDSETPMELENLATLHLDILATKEGFK